MEEASQVRQTFRSSDKGDNEREIKTGKGQKSSGLLDSYARFALLKKNVIGFYAITGYNAARLWKEEITFFTIKGELQKVCITKLTTMFGHTVSICGLAQTACDCLRNRTRMDIAIVTDAIKRYARRKNKNLNMLMQMAETFGVFKLVQDLYAGTPVRTSMRVKVFCAPQLYMF